MQGFLHHPASDPICYGLYVQHIAPHNAFALSPVKHTIVSIPEVLIESDLAPNQRINMELSRDILTCNNKDSPWRSTQKQRMLSGPLKLVHGWRFDGLKCKDKRHSSAQQLLKASPSVMCGDQ